MNSGGPVSGMTQDELHAKADQDHAQALGRVLLAKVVSGYRDDECIDVICDPPARLRVAATPRLDLHHWTCDGWLDPYWNVELVEPHPALAGMTSLWTFGPSYNITTGEIQGTSEWSFEDPPKETP